MAQKNPYELLSQIPVKFNVKREAIFRSHEKWCVVVISAYSLVVDSPNRELKVKVSFGLLLVRDIFKIPKLRDWLVWWLSVLKKLIFYKTSRKGLKKPMFHPVLRGLKSLFFSP